MVTITRSLARLLRAVLRKAGLGKSGAQPDAFVHVSTDNDGLRLRVAGPDRRPSIGSPVRFVRGVRDAGRGPGTIEGRTHEPVTLDASDPTDSSLALLNMVCRSCSPRTIDRKASSPPGPSYGHQPENSADLWSALREALPRPIGTDPVRVELLATARPRRHRRHRRSSHLDPERLHVPLGRQSLVRPSRCSVVKNWIPVSLYVLVRLVIGHV